MYLPTVALSPLTVWKPPHVPGTLFHHAPLSWNCGGTEHFDARHEAPLLYMLPWLPRTSFPGIHGTAPPSALVQTANIAILSQPFGEISTVTPVSGPLMSTSKKQSGWWYQTQFAEVTIARSGVTTK